MIQVDIRLISSICRRVARRFSQNDFTNSLPNGTTPDSCPLSAHHLKPKSEQRITTPSSRPTSEQRNTAPSSKTDERAAEHRAIVEGRQTSSGLPRHCRLERNDSGIVNLSNVSNKKSQQPSRSPPLKSPERRTRTATHFCPFRLSHCQTILIRSATSTPIVKPF